MISGNYENHETISFHSLEALPVKVAHEGWKGPPTKNIIVLLATVSGQGDNSSYAANIFDLSKPNVLGGQTYEPCL